MNHQCAAERTLYTETKRWTIEWQISLKDSSRRHQVHLKHPAVETAYAERWTLG